jgi:hypothetical protein
MLGYRSPGDHHASHDGNKSQVDKVAQTVPRRWRTSFGVPLTDDVERQWPQMGEVVSAADLAAGVEGNFPELTLEIGRLLHLDDVVVVEWTCNYGDGRLYRNVTIGELENGKAVRVTDNWGEPRDTPNWRRPLTGRLEMPSDGVWPDNAHLRALLAAAPLMM